MRKQIQLITLLFEDLDENLTLFRENGGHSIGNCNWMDKNHGKTAIKRKITILRQELLNLEGMVDNE